MPALNDAESVAQRALALIAGGEVGNALIRLSGKVGKALPVTSPKEELESWIVPVTVGDRLAGFIRFLPDLTMTGFSTFQCHEGSLEGCPESKTWLDEAFIQKRFAEQVRPGETAGRPFLTYDRYPDRLAWAVKLNAIEGPGRKLYLAGRALWEDTGTEGPEQFG